MKGSLSLSPQESMGLYFRLEVGHVNGKDNEEEERTRTA
jgi:hypothetical protein